MSDSEALRRGAERIRIQRRKQISDSYSYPQLATDTSGLRTGTAQTSVIHEISRISMRPQGQLTVSQPGDFYEQEADRVAQQVMGMGDRTNHNAIQRETSPQEEEENLQLKSLGNMITPLVQREEIPEEEEEENLQMKSLDNLAIQREEIPEEEEEEELIQAKSSLQRFNDVGLAASSDISSRLHSRKGEGSPITDDVRNFMEPRFGVDFSHVKIHTDGEAVQMARGLGAQAFTYGRDVYFGSGKLPGNNELTAHELTHVVQQTFTPQVQGDRKLIQRQERTNSAQVTWAQIEARLQNSSRGREALQIKAQYQVPIGWNPQGAAASFSPDTKVCQLNPNQALDVVASYFVHEMYHAQMFHTNQSADAKKLGEDTFVKRMVDEEIMGTIRQFEAKLELDKLGDSKNFAPGEDLYRSAYKYKRNEAIKAGESEQEAHQKGLSNASKMVSFLIRPTDGTWPRLAPSTYESYEMMYKREWRQTNKLNKH
ncbi:MAG: DUF4157 domain-containing protein [Nostoc sp.]